MYAAVRAGHIDMPRARVFCDVLSVLPDEVARAVCGKAEGEAAGAAGMDHDARRGSSPAIDKRRLDRRGVMVRCSSITN